MLRLLTILPDLARFSSSLGFAKSNLKELGSPSTKKYISSLLCLLSLLIGQPVSAQVVSLGGAYSQFDDLYIVATVPNTTQNCANLITTIAAISGVGTVKLPPVTYDCGETTLLVPSGVTLEGSGEQNTKIIGEGTLDLQNAIELYVVEMSTGTELNNLTVEGASLAIRSFGSTVLNHVTVVATANVSGGFGISVSPATGGEIARFNDITIDVAGDVPVGLSVGAGATVTLNGAYIRNPSSIGGSGISMSGITTTVQNSFIQGAWALATDSGVVNVKHSELQWWLESVDQGAGTANCFSVHDQNFTELPADCFVPDE